MKLSNHCRRPYTILQKEIKRELTTRFQGLLYQPAVMEVTNEVIVCKMEGDHMAFHKNIQREGAREIAFSGGCMCEKCVQSM